MAQTVNPRPIPKVISEIVSRDLCIGCGACAPVCPSKALRMAWSANGLYQPQPAENACAGCGACLRVCPFASGLSSEADLPDEDVLAEDLTSIPSSRHDTNLGHYLSLHAGYATAFREFGSSGGTATWALSRLLEAGDVDAVFALAAVENRQDTHFDYLACRSADEVRAAARTRYYPSKLDQVIEFALNNEGRYALVALPCAIKALRLAQRMHPVLRERIVFVVGVFCGGLKTRYYTEYLAAAAGCRHEQVFSPEYRIKNPGSAADDYAFGCRDANGTPHTIRMRVLGDMWGTGLFKANACDYCDDLSSELADISVGDAWIPPYTADGMGTSIVAIRSAKAAALFDSGIRNGELVLEPLSAEQVNTSQRGNINHRRRGLAYRLLLARRRGDRVPVKRVRSARPLNPIFALIQRLRMRVRRLSHEAWLAQRERPGTDIYDCIMKKDLSRLHSITRFSYRLGGLVHWLKSRLQAF